MVASSANPASGPLDDAARAAARLTNSQAADLARYIGFDRRVKDVPIGTMGQHVFTNGRGLFISQDLTMHQGVAATWKVFDRNFDRLGTFDAFLMTRLGK